MWEYCRFCEIGHIEPFEIGRIIAAPYAPRSRSHTVTEALIHPDRCLCVPDFGNQVLDGLPAEQRLELKEHLEEVVLKAGDMLAAKGQIVSHVYFPIDALASLFSGGRDHGIEAASIGSNGLTAPTAVLGDTTALGDTVVQIGGRAWRISLTTLLQLSEKDPGLRNYLVDRVCRALRELMVVSLSVGRLTITARLARWLAQASRSVGTLQLNVTHWALAEILAVRRPSISIGLQIIEGYGLIRSTRRSIIVLNLDGLTALGSFDSGDASVSSEHP